MIYTKKFYKNLDNRWFIDLPELIDRGFSMEMLEMVMGADEMLDFIAKDSNEVIIKFGDTEIKDSLHLIKVEIDEDNEGATYMPLNRFIDFNVWLCSITLELFEGQYPGHLWFKKIK